MIVFACLNVKVTQAGLVGKDWAYFEELSCTGPLVFSRALPSPQQKEIKNTLSMQLSLILFGLGLLMMNTHPQIRWNTFSRLCFVYCLRFMEKILSPTSVIKPLLATAYSENSVNLNSLMMKARCEEENQSNRFSLSYPSRQEAHESKNAVGS